MANKQAATVPRSNETAQTKPPAILRMQVAFDVTCRSATALATDVRRGRPVIQAAGAGPDIIRYACLVALAAGPPGAHAVGQLTAAPPRVERQSV